NTVVIPPRTRAHAREQGISEEELRAIPAISGKLMPSDVDAFIAARTPEALEPGAKDAPSPGFVAHSLSDQQRAFLYRLKRSAQIVVPATIMRPIEWQPVKRCVEKSREQDYTFRPTEFQTFAFCAAQTVADFPKFRSVLPTD